MSKTCRTSLSTSALISFGLTYMNSVVIKGGLGNRTLETPASHRHEIRP
jgi:hypothetical protein